MERNTQNDTTTTNPATVRRMDGAPVTCPLMGGAPCLDTCAMLMGSDYAADAEGGAVSLEMCAIAALAHTLGGRAVDWGEGTPIAANCRRTEWDADGGDAGMVELGAAAADALARALADGEPIQAAGE